MIVNTKSDTNWEWRRRRDTPTTFPLLKCCWSITVLRWICGRLSVKDHLVEWGVAKWCASMERCEASRQDPNASSTGNYLPCWVSCEKTYQVLGTWPETLWKQRKISSVTYEKLLFLSRDGVVSRKRNLEAGQEREEAAALKLALITILTMGGITLFTAFWGLYTIAIFESSLS